MTLGQQTLLILGLVQLIFGYYEYRARPDMFTVAGKLFQPKYLISDAAIGGFYYIFMRFILPLLVRFLTWFFNVG